MKWQYNSLPILVLQSKNGASATVLLCRLFLAFASLHVVVCRVPSNDHFRRKKNESKLSINAIATAINELINHFLASLVCVSAYMKGESLFDSMLCLYFFSSYKPSSFTMLCRFWGLLCSTYTSVCIFMKAFVTFSSLSKAILVWISCTIYRRQLN